MTPEELAALVCDLEAAATVVEAINDRGLQSRQGWDLRGWQYELVPWGVRFTRPDGDGGAVAAVLVQAMPQGASVSRVDSVVGPAIVVPGAS